MFPPEEEFGKGTVEIASWSSHKEDIGLVWFWWYLSNDNSLDY